MLEEIYAQTKDHMEKSIEALKKDYKSLRTGKVNVNILDGIVLKTAAAPRFCKKAFTRKRAKPGISKEKSASRSLSSVF